MKTLDSVFQDFLQWHEWERSSRPATIRHHRLNFQRFTDFLRNTNQLTDPPLEQFNQDNVRNYLMHRIREDNVAPRTNLGNWQDLKAFSNYLLRHEIIAKDPMRNISRPRVERKMPDALNADQVKELMRFMLSRRKKRYRIAYLRDLALISTFVYAGLRRNEALCLKVSDVDFDNNILRLMYTKTRRQEVVPMCSSLKNILLNYHKARMSLKRNTDHFFVDSNRQGFTAKRGDGSFQTRGVQLLFQEINDNIGEKIGKRITPHLLRRSFATMLLRKGSNIVQVSRLLRHKDISTTVKSYIGYDEQELMQVVEKFHPLSLKV